MLDGIRLIQVLDIIVDKAVKFSDKLPAQVEVHLAELSDGIATAVVDRGRGVPEVLRHRIFERFFQVEDVEHHSTTGLGLGLYIAREIVEAQGGSIWHEPHPGGGSIFRVHIPLSEQPR